MKINTLPTGYLFSDKYSRGDLETLSIGDYGKGHNVKADFLGYDRELHGVSNTECMPLSEKWVITLSTQFGCPQKCTFCDVPKLGYRGNATLEDLNKQLYSAIGLFPSQRYCERMNIHYARMGEPIYNDAVFEHAVWMYNNKRKLKEDLGLSIETLHPVMTTSLPKKFKKLENNILRWCEIKNDVYNGQAGLQFSINSTCEEQRTEMYQGLQLSLEDLARIADKMPEPVSRKYCLNFAYATDYEVDGKRIAQLFDQEKFMCKITPIHNNSACRENGIVTVDGYDSYLPYKKPEQSLVKEGFDVLVFIPSMDEEQGLVTCGNLTLTGSKVNVEQVINIKGYRRRYFVYKSIKR